ncbi:MAG TPA: cytochrome c biogenesis protein DipZ [Streptosporangiaceae bacterium]|jgi:cytochrome c biogenesis protein CcdA/thiol-disulfide isomerase/thioredoxin|nr:cytochrome c biogenesis protein DipZ [Streptosporangiaceae bacterium]
MIGLILVGAVAGFLAGISPCILPLLPVVLVAGAARPVTDSAGPAEPTTASTGTTASRGGLARPLAVVLGLVLSFSVLILAGSEIISLLHLPADSLRDAGIALLALVGLGYLIPPLGALLERPFARIRVRRPNGSGGGFALGLALGVLYVPCAGPVLAAITVVGATHRVGLTAVFVTAAFAIGTAVPLLAVALAGGQLSRRLTAIRRRAPQARVVGGVVLIGMAVAIAFNAFQGLEQDVPSYSSALQGSAKVRSELNSLTGVKQTSLTKCNSSATTLVDCGPAPNFTGITAWLNTPGGKPLTMAGLRGKVVLVDFWTYSCINCQRTLPHVEAWYSRYAKDGFVVVGVHTPEFAFEHVVSNVIAQSAALGVHYPVAVDDNYATWNAYDNEYWPADYLIDAQGNVRHVAFGEGDYSTTEKLIRTLLADAHPGLALPPPTNVPDRTPTGELSPETYVGYDRLQYLVPSTDVVENAPSAYQFPASLPLGGMGLSGTWTEHAEEATAGPRAELELGFLAQDVYLVMGGQGSVSVSIDGKHMQTIQVAGIPRLYTLYSANAVTSGTMLLQMSPGVQAYDFTFG